MKEVCENPTARIAVKKNVVKTYEVDEEKSVYLKDGTEFEIELFNPTKSVVLAKIKLNGKFINGGGLVLNPGQRVFLERFLEEDKKFKFSTYLVDNKNEIVEQAIKDNGVVEVYFYNEIASSWTTTTYTPYSNPFGSGGTFYYSSEFITTGKGYSSNQGVSGNTGPSGTLGLTGTSITASGSSSNMDCCYNVSTTNSGITKASCKDERIEKETGRVEKGGKSKQQFTYTDKYFASSEFYKVIIKILPEGEKIYGTEDLKHKKYCSECGSKLKPNDKFCSQCGYKI